MSNFSVCYIFPYFHTYHQYHILPPFQLDRLSLSYLKLDLVCIVCRILVCCIQEVLSYKIVIKESSFEWQSDLPCFNS
jgi:hypothetical protein